MVTTPHSLAETAAELRSGDRDVSDYLENCCNRLETDNSNIKAFLAEPDRQQRVMREATALEEEYSHPDDRPPLFGVPVGVKDIFHVDGFPTKAGSELPHELLSGDEATVITRLRDAGAIVLGKTVTTEFAYFAPGPTCNPHDVNHTPGGSSSGSAAAVAAGECPLALGTQTIGSTLRPAAFCGIVGFKPSYGRIPLDGVLPLATSVDHVGLFTQDIEGMQLAASVVIDEWDSVDPSRSPVLGIPEGPYLEQASETGLSSFERQVNRLENAGYEIRQIEAFTDIERLNERHNTLVAAEAALVHHQWFAEYSDRYHESTVDLIQEGYDVTVEEVAAARDGRSDLRTTLNELSSRHGIDLWISPAAPGPAPEGLQSTGDPAMNLPWTHAGVPAVSLPAGRVDSLPLGLQTTASFMEDERLLAWSERIAAALAG